MDVTGHDADLARVWRDDAGAVRAHEDGVGRFQSALYAHHVQHWDAFGDCDDQRDFRVDGFEDRVRCERGWDVDHARIGPGFGNRFMAGIEDRQIKVRLAAFARGHTTDHLRSVSNRLLGMEGALAAGKALTDDLGVFVDEDCHSSGSLFLRLKPLYIQKSLNAVGSGARAHMDNGGASWVQLARGQQSGARKTGLRMCFGERHLEEDALAPQGFDNSCHSLFGIIAVKRHFAAAIGARCGRRFSLRWRNPSERVEVVKIMAQIWEVERLGCRVTRQKRREAVSRKGVHAALGVRFRGARFGDGCSQGGCQNGSPKARRPRHIRPKRHGLAFDGLHDFLGTVFQVVRGNHVKA